MATAEDKQAAQYDGTNPVEVAEANAGDEIVVEWARWWNDNHPGESTRCSRLDPSFTDGSFTKGPITVSSHVSWRLCRCAERSWPGLHGKMRE